jgi:hypothetical protein
VSLSDSGRIVAVGATENFAGTTRVYQHDGVDWQQLGSDIAGSDVGELAYSVNCPSSQSAQSA